MKKNFIRVLVIIIGVSFYFTFEFRRMEKDKCDIQIKLLKLNNIEFIKKIKQECNLKRIELKDSLLKEISFISNQLRQYKILRDSLIKDNNNFRKEHQVLKDSIYRLTEANPSFNKISKMLQPELYEKSTLSDDNEIFAKMYIVVELAFAILLIIFSIRALVAKSRGYRSKI